jgi:hypothetical protein
MFKNKQTILATFQRERGYWIAKPVASSRGRGITIISHVSLLSLTLHSDELDLLLDL